MKLFASVKVRIFVTAWVIFSAHFATNVVREHYPAFALVDKGNFQVDEYDGFHSDIFVHTDGHAYIGNQVGTSVLAAVPLWLFDPVLDALEAHSKEKLATAKSVDAEYRSEYPLRQVFFQKVKENGWELRFGAATAITVALLMAPLSALFCVLLFSVLRERGVDRRRAVWLTMLFAFATPVFYRTAQLNNNMVLMYLEFAAFWLLWPKPGREDVAPTSRVVGAGLLAGLAMVIDYAAVVILPVLFAYVVLTRRRRGDGWSGALGGSVPLVLASIPGVVLLCFTQWAMFGDPFRPGQYHMPDVNYTDRGWRGMSLPSLDLFFENLLSPNWGMFTFAPLLALGFVPLLLRRRAADGASTTETAPILPRWERRFVFAYVLLFLVFCAANQYSRMQWNTGFRYLLPLVPFLFLAAADHLVTWSDRALWIVTIPAVLHTWVLCQVRYTVPMMDMLPDGNAVLGCWERFLDSGVQLPWLTVLSQTSPPGSWLHHPLLPAGLLAACGVVIAFIWRVGARRERSLA